jgi:hypothetical protein
MTVAFVSQGSLWAFTMSTQNPIQAVISGAVKVPPIRAFAQNQPTHIAADNASCFTNSCN